MSSRLLDTRDYLTHNVLAILEADQQEFLVRTCVLGRLSGPWCDQLMNTSGSARRLEDLARRHLFLVSHDGGNTYQEHEVLRSFLEELLLDRVGEQGTRALYAEAGSILEMGGRPLRSAPGLLPGARLGRRRPAAGRLGRPGGRPVGAVGRRPAASSGRQRRLVLVGDGAPSGAFRPLGRRRWRPTAALRTIATGALVRQTCERERFQLVGWMDPDCDRASRLDGRSAQGTGPQPSDRAGRGRRPRRCPVGRGPTRLRAGRHGCRPHGAALTPVLPPKVTT